MRSAARAHPLVFWSAVLGLTVVLTLEPGLFLVGLALALSGVTLVWIALLIHALLADWRARAMREPPVPVAPADAHSDSARERSAEGFDRRLE
jgi:threonine/homoserine/homoserine lactone efflux protein